MSQRLLRDRTAIALDFRPHEVIASVLKGNVARLETRKNSNWPGHDAMVLRCAGPPRAGAAHDRLQSIERLAQRAVYDARSARMVLRGTTSKRRPRIDARPESRNFEKKLLTALAAGVPFADEKGGHAYGQET
jgi:hypothetical protein